MYILAQTVALYVRFHIVLPHNVLWQKFKVTEYASTKSEAKRALFYRARFVYFGRDVWKFEPLFTKPYFRYIIRIGFGVQTQCVPYQFEARNRGGDQWVY